MNKFDKAGLNLSPPWYTHQKMLEKMFELDESVSVGPIVTDDNDMPSLVVFVADHHKAAALSRMLKSPDYGNVHLTVTVQDTAEEHETDAELVKTALSYNRIVKDIVTQCDQTNTPHTYVVFQPDVCQFMNDDTSDYMGNYNALFEDVARELFNDNIQVQYCTADLREN